MNNPNHTADDTANDTRAPDDQHAAQDVPSDGESTDAETPGDAETPAGTADESGNTGSRLVTVVEYATFGILCLLALVATFRFYFAASEAVRVWFSSDFVPVFQAAFNLVVLLAAALGISVLVRRIGS